MRTIGMIYPKMKLIGIAAKFCGAMLKSSAVVAVTEAASRRCIARYNGVPTECEWLKIIKPGIKML